MITTEPDFKSDENALEIFSKLMAHKLAKKSAEGRSGWQQCSQADLSRMLREHVEKGDPVDVANFCMMLKANGFNIAAAPVPPAGDVEVEYPAGAIHNGRAFADQLESIYAFKEQGGHILSLCSEWQSFVQCFEHLVQSVDDHRAHFTRLTAENAELQKQLGERWKDIYAWRETAEQLQSELTKARELLIRLRNCKWIPTAEWQHEVSEVLAHQSAPAAKGGSDE